MMKFYKLQKRFTKVDTLINSISKQFSEEDNIVAIKSTIIYLMVIFAIGLLAIYSA